MDRDTLTSLALAITLTSVAGFVDACGFLKLDYYVSFMSGDSTRLAVSLSRGAMDKAASVLGIIALFIAGVVIGRLLETRMKDWSRATILLADGVLLAIGAALADWPIFVVPVVLAMGLQSEIFHKAGETKVASTYVTGTLVRAGESIADAIHSGKKEGRFAFVPYFLLWAGLVCGALVGATAFMRHDIRALVAPAILLVLLAAVVAAATLIGRRRKRAEPLSG